MEAGLPKRQRPLGAFTSVVFSLEVGKKTTFQLNEQASFLTFLT